MKLSGRGRNLPGHVVGDVLMTGAGEDVALVSDAGGAAVTAEDGGLTLALRATLAPKGVDDDLGAAAVRVVRGAECGAVDAERRGAAGARRWRSGMGSGRAGARVHYPEQVLNDFFDSSIAYVLILTEYDAKGDLWTSGWAGRVSAVLGARRVLPGAGDGGGGVTAAGA